jgi:hypothetical protein
MNRKQQGLEVFSEMVKKSDHALNLLYESRKSLNEVMQLLKVHERPIGIQPLCRQGELFPVDSILNDEKLSQICLGCLVETI